ncbi:MAG: hypothetical protein NUV84_00480, partial [Candidatus Uhrbacteria bacterium]|nr:hypothetical protein [Candidatus Uhrbacteria bacterium]
DYAQGIQEGCCYYLSGSFDLNDSVENLEEQVESQFREIFLARKIDVDGRPAFAFFYMTDYITTQIHEVYLVPVDGEEFAHVLFVSPTLYETQEGVIYDEAIDSMRILFERVDLESDQVPVELDQARLGIFRNMLATVQWDDLKIE